MKKTDFRTNEQSPNAPINPWPLLGGLICAGSAALSAQLLWWLWRWVTS